MKPPDNVPTLTETHTGLDSDTSPLLDPLVDELFEKLHDPPSNELSQTWQTIKEKVDLLTQQIAAQRELQDSLRKLDDEIDSLRNTITALLENVQHAADQQLSAARLRAEASALVQSKLAEKLAAKR